MKKGEMKMKYVSMVIVFLTLSACTKEPAPSGPVGPVGAVVCGVTDALSGVAALETQKRTSCKNYANIKQWWMSQTDKIYNCNGDKEGIICESALKPIGGKLIQSKLPADWDCPSTLPPDLDILVTNICKKSPI